MESEEIKRVIVAQKEEIKEKFEKTRIIDREVDKNRIKRYISAPNVLVILGIRRCGKSMFSLQILEGIKYGYINFDDERLVEFCAKDFEKLLQSFYELYREIDYIILDEPHNIEGWELFVNRLRRTKRVIVTGSNSRLLSGELASRLTGRYVDFTLFPFSFNEFLSYNNVSLNKEDFYSTTKIAIVKRNLDDYLRIGGLPEVYLFGREVLVRIFSDIVEKDILKRLRIKKKSIFKEVAKYLISNSSCEITLSKLKNIFEVKDLHTIRDWINGMEEAYLIEIINRFSPKLKEQFIAPKKVYCTDIGIVNTIGFKLSQNIGKIIENLVATELLRRKSYRFADLDIFYWKDYQQNEVDFVLKEVSTIKQLIQVTYANSRDEIENRELKSLLKASKELRCKNLAIITWDYEDELKINEKNITCIPLWKWLLAQVV